MNHRGVRVLVWLVACTVVGSASYAVFDLERRVRAERAEAAAFAATTHALALEVERLRAAQQSYVAEGQGAEFWMGRANATLAALESGLGTLAADTRLEAPTQAAQAALKVLAEVRQLDRRTRELLRQGQRLAASDLIFSDSLGATGALALRIDNARQARAEHAAAMLPELQERQLYVLAGAAALTLFLALVLVPRPRAARAQDARGDTAAPEIDAAPAGNLSLRPDRDASFGVERERARPAPAVRAPAAPAPPAVASAPPALTVDLAGTAHLCADMARVLDAADLPRLLERAAALLHASGVIVWVADGAGTALFPAVAHGYPASLLARMPTINRDDDNAAAAAWRMGETRTVPAVGGAPGALVSPIVTSEGCVGVLAAEVQGGAEGRSEVRAIATILASQLATFVTALPSPQQNS
jgi:hypothetical protein